MRVDASKQGASGRAGARPDQTAKAAPVTETRALVVLAPAASPAPTASFRQTGFLAHLIATENHAPQTRLHRRADPSEAMAAYRTAKALMRPATVSSKASAKSVSA